MSEPERSPAWTSFAAITIGILGVLNVVIGTAALTKKEYFDEGSLLFENLAFWGWVWLVIGGLQLLTAVLIVLRMTAGTALGLIGASVSLLIWFFTIGAHPTSSIVIIALDVLIIYALTAERPGSSTGGEVPDRTYGSPGVQGPRVG